MCDGIEQKNLYGMVPLDHQDYKITATVCDRMETWFSYMSTGVVIPFKAKILFQQNHEVSFHKTL